MSSKWWWNDLVGKILRYPWKKTSFYILSPSSSSWSHLSLSAHLDDDLAHCELPPGKPSWHHQTILISIRKKYHRHQHHPSSSMSPWSSSPFFHLFLPKDFFLEPFSICFAGIPSRKNIKKWVTRSWLQTIHYIHNNNNSCFYFLQLLLLFTWIFVVPTFFSSSRKKKLWEKKTLFLHNSHCLHLFIFSLWQWWSSYVLVMTMFDDDIVSHTHTYRERQMKASSQHHQPLYNIKTSK